jgi:transposase
VRLIGDWTGILVRDGYRIAQAGAGLRQSCLAHLIRAAKGRAESGEAGRARFGERGRAALQRLGHRGTERPTVGQGRAWAARFSALGNQPMARPAKAGPGLGVASGKGEALWVLLDVPGVEATHTIAERAHRFGVLGRKRSQGTGSEKGTRWGERVVPLRHPCRIRGRPAFPLLVAAVSCRFTGERPDLSWITRELPIGQLDFPS